MTKENREFVGFCDIIAIQYKCKKCGSTVSIPRDKWGIPQRYCPGACSNDPARPAYWIPIDSIEDQALIGFQKVVKLMIESKAMGCEVSLEIKADSEPLLSGG